MKTPTTPFSIAVQDTFQITRDFLISQEWVLDKEYPLFETFKHSRDGLLHCAIGLYGEFSIQLLHWCNETPERQFSTVNRGLTKDDYFTILNLLAIKP